MGKAAAFFDMDHTLTWENSGLSFSRYSREKGMISARHLLVSLFKIILYRLSFLNIERWYEKNMEILSGSRLTDLEEYCSVWFRQTLGKAIYREAFELVQDHREKGHHLVIISNSPTFFVRPMAEALSIADIICTRVEIEDGVLTGRLIKPLCYGEGKKLYAQEWADGNGIDLMQSYFYTDSFFDIALMEAVGFPCATNPDIKLRRAAAEHGWPVVDFRREPAF